MSLLTWTISLFCFSILAGCFCLSAYINSARRQWFLCVGDICMTVATVYVLWDMNFGSMALNQ